MTEGGERSFEPPPQTDNEGVDFRRCRCGGSRSRRRLWRTTRSEPQGLSENRQAQPARVGRHDPRWTDLPTSGYLTLVHLGLFRRGAPHISGANTSLSGANTNLYGGMGVYPTGSELTGFYGRRVDRTSHF
jgi:hypothetical protein